MFYIIIIAVIVAVSTFYTLRKPSNNRNWSEDQKVLPHAEINGENVTMHDIRNIKYSSEDDYSTNYYDKTFDLNNLKAVYYNITPFRKVKSAHTFLTFEFSGDNFVSVSIEIRKKVGQRFSALKGLIRWYELMYVVADERDLIQLRALHRNDSVYVYPLNLKEKTRRELFMDIVSKVNSLYEKPEFYNTVTNACNTNIARHMINGSSSHSRIPYDIRIIFPADSDVLAQELGLIDDDLPLKKLREKYLVNKRVIKYADRSDFSTKIREPLEV